MGAERMSTRRETELLIKAGLTLAIGNENGVTPQKTTWTTAKKKKKLVDSKLTSEANLTRFGEKHTPFLRFQLLFRIS